MLISDRDKASDQPVQNYQTGHITLDNKVWVEEEKGEKKGGESMDVDHQNHKGPWENDDKAEENKVKVARLSHM